MAIPISLAIGVDMTGLNRVSSTMSVGMVTGISICVLHLKRWEDMSLYVMDSQMKSLLAHQGKRKTNAETVDNKRYFCVGRH